jgi:hypothetical protein
LSKRVRFGCIDFCVDGLDLREQGAGVWMGVRDARLPFVIFAGRFARGGLLFFSADRFARSGPFSIFTGRFLRGAHYAKRLHRSRVILRAVCFHDAGGHIDFISTNEVRIKTRH